VKIDVIWTLNVSKKLGSFFHHFKLEYRETFTAENMEIVKDITIKKKEF